MKERMTSKTDDKQRRKPLRFLLGFVIAAISVLLTLRILGLMFAYSPTTAFLAGAILLFLLYSTARRWVEWLPSLLVFGVFNSLIGLITHHSPRSSAIFVS